MENIEDRELTIGDYEYAWLADLVASYILDNAKSLFKETTIHYEIYRDDGIVFLKGKWNSEDIKRWQSTFQLKVNDLLKSEKLKFTSEVWSPSEKVSNARKYDNSITSGSQENPTLLIFLVLNNP